MNGDSRGEKVTGGNEKGNARPPTGELLAGSAIVLFGFLLFTLRGVLNPFILLLALAVAFWPLRRSVWFWPVIGSATALTFYWLLRELGFLLAPFVLALVLAYILNPAVDWIARKPFLGRLDRDDPHLRTSRSVAILMLSLPLILGAAGVGIWGVPFLAREVQDLAQGVPDILERVAELVATVEDRLNRLRLPGIDGSEWVSRIRDLDEADIVAFFQNRAEDAGQRIWQGAVGLGRGIGSLLAVLGYVVLTPVLVFYLLRDYRKMEDQADALIPPEHEGLRDALREYDKGLSAYLRGQLTVAMVVGALTTVGLLIAQFPFAILLGVFVAVMGFVPYLGLILSLIPAVGIALASGNPGNSLLTVAIVFGVVQTLEGTIISPRILGDSTGLHPVWVLLAISLGGYFFGFVGLLIAVPAAVGVKIVIVRAIRRYRASSFFGANGDGSGAEKAAATSD